MTYRRAVIPALAGGLLLTALLWWAGASLHALQLKGTTSVIDGRATAELQRWLFAWSYDPPASVLPRTDGGHYRALYATAMQIRFGAVFAFFVPGALLLIRRLPPVRGRMPATLLAVWAWGVVAGTLAVTVSAPWLIASEGRGSYGFLPNLASSIAGGRQALIVTGLVAAAVAVIVARVTAEGAGPLPQPVIPAPAARLAAGVGTAVIAVSLVVLSYHPVVVALQTASPYVGTFGGSGSLLRQWLLLGIWAGPAGGSVGYWLLYRLADALVLAVVWFALRRLPLLLTRATLPAMVTGAVCATVLGLLAGQLLRIAARATIGTPYGPLHLFAGLGHAVPAALAFGLLAGAAAAVTLRLTVPRTDPPVVPGPAGAPVPGTGGAPSPEPPQKQDGPASA